jgi:hypothetical protein|nr:hypothetical protein [Kofleriaceae bacterium]
MGRTLACVVAACALLALVATHARADAVDKEVRDLKAEQPYKVRLAGVLALAKSKDARAVIALSGVLSHDDDATLRKLSALALDKMVDAHTDVDARELALGALEMAAANDTDTAVRDAAARVAKSLAALHDHAAKTSGSATSGNSSSAPQVFVRVDTVLDATKKLPQDGVDRLSKVVTKTVATTGYATSWAGGGVPTSAELGTTRAFIVASTVKTIDVTRSGHLTQIACTVQIRVAPWGGKDTGERWEANKAASASGTAKATTGSGDRDIQTGVKDCIEAVGEDITQRQVVPFLKKLASNP